MVRETVIRNCELFSLEEKTGRTAYSKKMSEILSDEKCGNISLKEVTKKYKEMGPDGGFERDEIWKLMEWDFFPNKGRKKEEKKTLEEEIP